MVRKGQMVGHHKFNSHTPRPVSTADHNEQGVTSEMRDHTYGYLSNYNDEQLYVGGTFSTAKRSDRQYMYLNCNITQIVNLYLAFSY